MVAKKVAEPDPNFLQLGAAFIKTTSTLNQEISTYRTISGTAFVTAYEKYLPGQALNLTITVCVYVDWSHLQLSAKKQVATYLLVSPGLVFL